VAKDEVEAVKWYKKAAAQGELAAQFSLGICYLIGRGVDKNPAEAVKWWHKAADQGEVAAQRQLGVHYEFGEGVAKDEVEAYAYYNLAATTDEDAKGKRDSLEKKLSPDARFQGQQRTRELKKEIEAKIAAKADGK
jgi:hypothetical protein